MKKNNDQGFSGTAFASFDHRSAAFRQKMFEHFQANSPKHCRPIEKFQGECMNASPCFSLF
jgi:hypothetical protein